MLTKKFCLIGSVYFLVFFAQTIFAEQTGSFSNLVVGNQDVPWQNMRDLVWFNRKLKQNTTNLFNYDFQLDFLMDGSTINFSASDTPSRALAKVPNVLSNGSSHDLLMKLNSNAVFEKSLSEYLVNNQYILNRKRIGALFTTYLEYKDCWFFLEVPLQFVQTQAKFLFETPIVRTEKNEFSADFIAKLDVLKQVALQNHSDLIPASFNISAGTSFLSSDIFKDTLFLRLGYPFTFSVGYRGVIEMINSNKSSFVKLFGSILGEVCGKKECTATTYLYNGFLSAVYDGNIFLAERDFYPYEKVVASEFVSTRQLKTIENEITDNKNNFYEVGKMLFVEEGEKISLKALCGLTLGRSGFYTSFGFLGNLSNNYPVDFIKENGINTVLSNNYSFNHLTQPMLKQFSYLAQVVYEDKIEDNIGYSLRVGCQKDFFVIGSNMKYLMAWFGGGVTF